MKLPPYLPRGLPYIPFIAGGMVAGAVLSIILGTSGAGLAFHPGLEGGEASVWGPHSWTKFFADRNTETFGAAELIKFRHSVQADMNSDLQRFIEALNNDATGGVLQNESAILALEKAANRDPRGTLELLLKLSPSQGRDSALLKVLESLTSSHPDEVAGFISQIPGYLMGRFSYELSDDLGNEKGVEAIVKLRNQLPASEWHPLFEEAMNSWGQRDGKSAASYLAGLYKAGVPGSKGELLWFVNNLVYTNPKGLLGGLDYLPQDTFAIDDTDSALNFFAQAGSLDGVAASDRNLAAATQFAEARPDGPERIKSLKMVAWVAASIDPTKASALASQLPAVNDREEIYDRAANFSFQKDPGKAATWAETIPDPIPKYTSEHDIAKSWIKKSPGDYAKYALSRDQAPEWVQFLNQEYPSLGDANAWNANTVPQWVNSMDPEDRARLQALSSLLK
jgi:hypothetical protein